MIPDTVFKASKCYILLLSFLGILSSMVEIPQKCDEKIPSPYCVVCKNDVIVGSHDLGTCMR